MDNENEEFCDDCGRKLDGQPKYRDRETLCESCYDSYEDTHAENCAECGIELDGYGEWYQGKMLCHDCIERFEYEHKEAENMMLGDDDEEQASSDWNERLDG